MISLIFLSFLLFSNGEFGRPYLNWEFKVDLDRDGLIDYVSLYLGRVALSSRSYKIEKIPKFNPFHATVMNNEIWIVNRKKAIIFRGEKVLLRDLTFKEQIWVRMYKIEPLRASILTFNLLVTLFSLFLSIERLYRTAYFFFSMDFSKAKEHFFRNIFSFSALLLFVFLLFLTKKFLYVLWIWAFEAFSSVVFPLFRAMKFFKIFLGILLVIFVLFFLYFSYFGFWFPSF
jgi:hypothetical protein